MMMMAKDDGSRGRVRRATSDSHARVDACFPRGFDDPGAYRRYLQGMLALVAAVEAALEAAPAVDSAWGDWRAPSRLEWLRRDLSDLDAAPLPPGPGFAFARPAEIAGALYVLEGSALGARQLLADAQALGWNSTRGARFLHGHAGGARWRAYLRCLEAAQFDGSDERGMIEAAARTFAYAEHEFLRAAQAGSASG